MEPIRRLKALLGLPPSTDTQEFQEPDFLRADFKILTDDQRSDLDALSDHVQEDVPDHPKPAPGNQWCNVENKLTDKGFTQLGVGHDRIVYQLPYEGLRDKAVKFARETAFVRSGFRGAAQNAAEAEVYRIIFNEYHEALPYFNKVCAMDGRSETFRWLITAIAEPAEDRYHVDGLEETFGIRPINPEVGFVNGTLVYVDYGEGFQVVNRDGGAVGQRGVFYEDAKRNRGGNGNIRE